MDDIVTKIQVPADEDGYIPQECPLCHGEFKAPVGFIVAERADDPWCPYCGLSSNSFLTEEQLEYAGAVAMDAVMEMLHGEFKKLERSTKNSTVSLKAGSRPKRSAPDKLYSKADDLVEVICPHCGQEEKVTALSTVDGCYCINCGGGFTVDSTK